MKNAWQVILILVLLLTYSPWAVAEGDSLLAPESASSLQDPMKKGSTSEINTIKANVDTGHILKAGDKVNIKIFPEDQYIRGGQYEITPEGNVSLPLIGKIKLIDQSISQASENLKKIIDKDYIIDPEVIIEIIGYKKETFVVLGQVQKPGTYNFPEGAQEFTFLQAISIAGGFSQVANIKKVKIIRQEAGQRKIMRINAENVIAGDSPDLKIESGDVIHVSESLF